MAALQEGVSVLGVTQLPRVVEVVSSCSWSWSWSRSVYRHMHTHTASTPPDHTPSIPQTPSNKRPHTKQVEQTLAGHTVRLLSKAPLPSLDLPKIRRNPLVEILPLSTGCLGACTYCKTRHARGKLGSYAVEAIVARARALLQVGGWVGVCGG